MEERRSFRGIKQWRRGASGALNAVEGRSFRGIKQWRRASGEFKTVEVGSFRGELQGNKKMERRSLNSGGEELQGNKTVEERSFRGIKCSGGKELQGH